MTLITCTDCQGPVSTRATACPRCGRPTQERSHLTPLAQTGVGALALVACLGWPPLFLILLLIGFVRFLGRTRHRETGRRVAAVAAVAVLAVLLTYLLPGYAPIVLVIGLAAAAWVLWPTRGERVPV